MLNKFILATAALVLAVTAHAAQLADEVIVAPTDPGAKKWTAEKVSMHDVWQKPACVASTEIEEDGKLSVLEVVAFYDENNDRFLEPEVNVITNFDVSFLDVVAKVSGSSKKYNMLPVLPDDENIVGARALLQDREKLVDSLRKLNSVTVRYLDTEGEVKSLRFSLSGSSNSIGKQFEACKLEFKDLPENLPILDELN